MLACTLLVSALLPLVAAQATNDLALQIEAIQAHFNQSRIVPNFLTSFAPTAILNVNFNGAGNISPGQRFTKEQVAISPTLTVQSAGPLEGQYTLAMLDADVPDTNLSGGLNRHWLLYGTSINQQSTVDNATATAITRYAGPFPPSGSGPHRYIIILYVQPSVFAPPAEFSQTGLPVAPMDWNTFVTNSRLGDIVAANYIQVEEGTASAAIPSTAAVVTSTLPPVSRPASSSAPAASATSSTTGASNNNNNGARGLSINVPIVMLLTTLTAFLV